MIYKSYQATAHITFMGVFCLVQMNIARCRCKKEITQLQENEQGNKSDIAIDKRDEVGLKFQDQ